MEYKARFIKALRNNNPFDRHAWEHTDLLYEYRGHEYIITKHNNGCMDKSLRQQHEEAQADIDRQIEEESKPKKEWQYEGSAQEGFDLFWEYLNTGEWREEK